jgi:hypothetical protein
MTIYEHESMSDTPELIRQHSPQGQVWPITNHMLDSVQVGTDSMESFRSSLKSSSILPVRGKPNTDAASRKVGIGETAQSEKAKPDLSRLRPKPLKSMRRPPCYRSSRCPLQAVLDQKARSPGVFLLQHAHPHLYYPVLDQLLCGSQQQCWVWPK